MGFIKCCGHSVSADIFMLVPDKNSSWAILKDMKDVCPHCHNYKIQIDKIDNTGVFQSIVYENEKAYAMRKKLIESKSIAFPIIQKDSVVGSAFYLNYSEYGKKKKCYSNLSTLKMGLFDNSEYVRRDLVAV